MRHNEELPVGWALAPLSDLLTGIETGKSFKCDERPPGSDETGVVKVSAVSWGEYQEQESKTCTDATRINSGLFVQTGDFLFSRANTIELVGACVIAKQVNLRVMLSDKILRFTFKSESMKSWVLNLLRSGQGRLQIEALASGNQDSMRNIGQARIGQILVPVPPVAEQSRIVEKLEELLSELDAGVAELKAAQRKLAQYRQSLLKAAVEGALTADWRAARDGTLPPPLAGEGRGGGGPEPEASTLDMPPSQPSPASGGRGEGETGAELLQRILTERRARWEVKQLAKFAEQGKMPPTCWQAKYPEPVAPGAAELPPLPDGWAWASVDQCSLDENAITDGPFGSNLKSVHYTEHGPRVLRLQNIGDGHFVDAKAHIAQEHFDQLRKHSVSTGDVVVAMLGEMLPRACVVPEGVEPAIVKADCARVRTNQELVMPNFLTALLNSEPTRKRVLGLIKGIGRPRVNLGAVRSISVPVASRDEQVQIEVALTIALDEANRLYVAIDQGFRLAAAQRKNILKAAFAGQLVAQDPRDQSASVLLERIRAERAAGGSNPIRRGRKGKETA